MLFFNFEFKFFFFLEKWSQNVFSFKKKKVYERVFFIKNCTVGVGEGGGIKSTKDILVKTMFF